MYAKLVPVTRWVLGSGYNGGPVQCTCVTAVGGPVWYSVTAVVQYGPVLQQWSRGYNSGPVQCTCVTALVQCYSSGPVWFNVTAVVQWVHLWSCTVYMCYSETTVVRLLLMEGGISFRLQIVAQV